MLETWKAGMPILINPKIYGKTQTNLKHQTLFTKTTWKITLNGKVDAVLFSSYFFFYGFFSPKVK